jgi:hypothetical protein
MSQRAVGIGRKTKVAAARKKRRVQPRLSAMERRTKKQLDELLTRGVRKQKKKKTLTEKKMSKPSRRKTTMNNDDKKHEKHAPKKPDKESAPDPMSTPPDSPPALPGDAEKHEKK